MRTICLCFHIHYGARGTADINCRAFPLYIFPRQITGTLLALNEQIRQYFPSFRLSHLPRLLFFFSPFWDRSVNEEHPFHNRNMRRDVNDYTLDYFCVTAIKYTRCSKKAGVHERQEILTFTFLLYEFLEFKNLDRQQSSSFLLINLLLSEKIKL